MAIRVALRHQTSYHYDRLVSLAPHLIRLRPAPHSRTPIVAYSLRVEPREHFINWQQDPHGNYLARLVFPDKTQQLRVDVDLVAEMSPINPFDFFLEPDAMHFPFAYDAWLTKEIRPFLETFEPGPRLRAFLADVDRTETPTIDFLVALNRRVQQAIGYVIRMEPGVQTPEETLTLAKGSCRDSAWLLVQILRHLGLAARFVSGYLIQLVADVKPLEGPAGPPADFTDLHAWTEVYLPGAGWVGLDPTSGLLAAEGHIPLACTPDPVSAAPIAGLVDPCEVEFGHAMRVERIHEDPRVTKPYTEAEWTEILDLGRRVDARLAAGDVRLTMGGEPTFVSVDDMDGEEWNTAALGPMKRRLAGSLLRRMKDRFAPGALLHFGQGKWYPGEPLPRWALGCYWRRDGVPLWADPRWIADDDKDYGYGPEESQAFVRDLAARLGVDARHVLPGYEDVWYYLWKERRLPANVDPFDSKLEDKIERARLARIFETGLAVPAGHALPLRPGYWAGEPIWVSGAWFFRPERMYLIPGDSPMGFRLPLDSLPWLAPEQRVAHGETDPFAPRRELPPRREPAAPSAEQAAARIRVQRPGKGEGEGRGAGDAADHHILHGPPVDATVRSAVCVEAREGRLHVFLPPVWRLEQYVDLVEQVEATAAALGTPVAVEGYPPPRDPRLKNFHVTPDPGVIEVNIHPSGSWEELVENTTALYDLAHESRLGTEKFMLDGRHTGTGGGNHVVMGGPTPADSAFLRRPDLLRSLVAFWHNHPSLSYVFSCAFIGPTSQAPRVDEARNDSVYELELAFREVAGRADPPPWIVDRVFRHLLVDLTGNTHRSEFCIDKLYSPDSASGRQGLVEFRAFEMPPHARMSLTQQLLLRALVARFWERPYEHRLVRWGTELHDRFMLPHFIEQDFGDVLDELGEAGFAFDPRWFAPHLEFRFPRYGTVACRDLTVELRQAIEPWNVLGEEVRAAGATRYVDSSVERVQVKVAGATDGRHVLACNGRRVPLRPTGRVGEFVAGVRYRAWQPPSCLHPTIGIHTPLVFDVVDTWSGRAIGGCTYRVAHPGGRHYETFPVNALEAEARRSVRFAPWGHTPGPVELPPEEPSLEFPMTLDLRR